MAVVEAIVTFDVWHGSGGDYDSCITYTDVDEMLRDVREAALAGRHLLIERCLMTREEHEWRARLRRDCGPEYPSGVNPLLGGQS